MFLNDQVSSGVLVENICFTLHGKGTMTYEKDKFFLQQMQCGLAKKRHNQLLER